MLIGYARVSTTDQNLDLQKDALTEAGCEKIYTDEVSGAKRARPGLDLALEMLREGDTLVVWKLDRLGRSLPHLIEVVMGLKDRGVGFRSLSDPMDTTTPTGKLVFQFFGAIAEFERDLIRERTNAGLAAARARGRKGGRKPKLSKQQQKLLYELADAKEKSVREICELLQISKKTYYRYLSLREAEDQTRHPST